MKCKTHVKTAQGVVLEFHVDNCPYCQVDTLQKDNDNLNTDLKEAEAERDAYQQLAIRIIKSKAVTFADINKQVSVHMVEHEALKTKVEYQDKVIVQRNKMVQRAEEEVAELLSGDSTLYFRMKVEEKRLTAEVERLRRAWSGAEDHNMSLIEGKRVAKAEIENLSALLFSVGKYSTGEDQLDAFCDTEALLELAKLVGAYDDPPRYSPEALNHKEK